jgi:predicted RNA-binding Zn ribbon-like protein
MDLLWLDFCNSDWHDWRSPGRSEDRLDKPDFLPRVLARWELTAPLPPDPDTLATLRSLRSDLRRMAETLSSGAPLPPDDLLLLNRWLQAGPVIRRLTATPDRPALAYQPLRQDWPQVMAEIAASFARTLTEGEGIRVRICDNPDCLWLFYDDTRNRAKRFCSGKECGNLMKVRRFRARQKSTP